MRFLGKEVTTVDPRLPADLQGDIFSVELPHPFDVVWSSHVIEHQRNVGLFLDKTIEACKPGGIICISCPPEISPYFLLCHPNQFTVGSLIYHLIMAGIDCRNVRALTYGYNVSIIVENTKHKLPKQEWAYEGEAAEFFPEAISRNDNQLFGPARSLNWTSRLDIAPHFNAHLS